VNDPEVITDEDFIADENEDGESGFQIIIPKEEAPASESDKKASAVVDMPTAGVVLRDGILHQNGPPI